MKKDDGPDGTDKIPPWAELLVLAIVAGIDKLMSRSNRRSLGPAETAELVRLVSAEVSRQVVEKQLTHPGFGKLIGQEIRKAAMNDDLGARPEKPSYHYIRYAMFFVYLAALGAIAEQMKQGIDGMTIRMFGVALTIVAIIVDWRNYRLYLEEKRVVWAKPGPVTWALTLFYLAMLFWFIFVGTIRWDPVLPYTPLD